MKIIFLIIPLFFISCVNKKGVSLHYYPECKEEYNLYGEYEVNCENNFYNFKDKKKKKAPFVIDNCLNCK